MHHTHVTTAAVAATVYCRVTASVRGWRLSHHTDGDRQRAKFSSVQSLLRQLRRQRALAAAS